jgi:hypothetical protein
MSNSIKDSFERAFAEKINKKDATHVESDEDSGKEAEKIIVRKRSKKRNRSQRGKNPKSRKVVSTFATRRAPATERVTTDKYPEILSVNDEFSTNTSQTELIIAEQKFFDKDNSENWSKGEYSHVRPVDYPFLRSLIQRTPLRHYDIHQKSDSERLRAAVQTCSRSYEQQFLREPIGSERPCLMGNGCEGLKINNAKDRAFIVREFLLPSEQKEYENSGKYPTEQRLCLMCKRLECARAFVNIRADGMGVREDTILPDYRNLIDVEGEYCLRDCIVSSRTVYEGILDPIVLHVRSAYRLVEHNGIRYYDQWRMSFPKKQDFREPPSQ